MESGEKIWKSQKLPYFFKGDIAAELTSDLKVLPINWGMKRKHTWKEGITTLPHEIHE